VGKKLLLGTAAASVVAFGVLSGTTVMTQVIQSGARAPAVSGVKAIRAGRLFDAKTGTMLTNQIASRKSGRTSRSLRARRSSISPRQPFCQG
jgi:hypothetical protein